MAQPLPAIKTRKPTGIVPPPLILIEGEEKSGKSFILAKLTASERVGDCFWIDLAEGAADEYGPIGNYQVVDHNGTFRDIYDQVRAIHAHATKQREAGEKPVVLGIDSMSAEWDMLKDWISGRAEKSNANKKLLADDPNAEIRIPNNLWNEANAKHKKLMRLLTTFPGIVVVTARGKEVAVIRNGKPVEGEKEWKPETQKGLPYDVTAWINMRRDGATLIGARSLHVGVQPGKDKPLKMPDEWYDQGLEWFIFDAMKFDPGAARTRNITELDTENVDDGEPTIQDLMQKVRQSWGNVNGLNIVLDLGDEYGLLDMEVEGPGGRPSTLRSIVGMRVQELEKGAQEKPRTRAPEPQDARADAQPDARQVNDQIQRPADEVRAEERAPEPQDAQNQSDARPQQPQPQATNGQDRLMELARREVIYQAEALGMSAAEYVQPMCVEPGNPHSFHVHKAKTYLPQQRPRVIESLRQQGRASEAEAYERRGDVFPMLLDFVGEQQGAQQPARQQQ